MWKPLKIRDFVVLDSPGMAKLALGGATGLPQKKTALRRIRSWVPGIYFRKLKAKIEIPVYNQPRSGTQGGNPEQQGGPGASGAK